MRPFGSKLDAVDIGRRDKRQRHPPCVSVSSERGLANCPQCGRPSPPASRWHRSAPPPSAGAHGRCRGYCRGGIGEALGAIAALKQEKTFLPRLWPSAAGRVRAFAREDERRIGLSFASTALSAAASGYSGTLLDGFSPPRRRIPGVATTASSLTRGVDNRQAVLKMRPRRFCRLRLYPRP